MGFTLLFGCEKPQLANHFLTWPNIQIDNLIAGRTGRLTLHKPEEQLSWQKLAQLKPVTLEQGGCCFSLPLVGGLDWSPLCPLHEPRLQINIQTTGLQTTSGHVVSQPIPREVHASGPIQTKGSFIAWVDLGLKIRELEQTAGSRLCFHVPLGPPVEWLE